MPSYLLGPQIIVKCKSDTSPQKMPRYPENAKKMPRRQTNVQKTTSCTYLHNMGDPDLTLILTLTLTLTPRISVTWRTSGHFLGVFWTTGICWALPKVLNLNVGHRPRKGRQNNLGPLNRMSLLRGEGGSTKSKSKSANGPKIPQSQIRVHSIETF